MGARNGAWTDGHSMLSIVMLNQVLVLALAATRDQALGLSVIERAADAAVVEGSQAVAIAADGAAAQHVRAALLLARHGRGRSNLALPTAGGLQLWADVFWGGGWRIQQHIWSGHHRLIDPAGVRRAWGDHAACRAVFAVVRARTGWPPVRRLVLGLAGMGRTRHALTLLRHALGPDDVLALVAYSSTRASLAEHALRLRRLLADLPDVERVAIVTHSLGALVARSALAAPAAERAQWPRIDGVVMLCPPNQGSALADRWHRTPPHRWLLGPAGQELTTAAAHAVPLPVDPVVIIAGGRGDGRGRNRHLAGDDDGTVRVAETWLPGAVAHHVIDVGHTFGVCDARVLAAVRTALAAF